ncbi:MAG: HAMP domain-containing sensor histidine kinase [Actinomycetota bacterium]|nr:HAMP domain-containing sensor histidine kinase [Actinomycetota bacterium]
MRGSPRLRTRAAASFAMLVLLISTILSIASYQFARSYLVRAGESVAITRALLDVQAVNYSIHVTGNAAEKAIADLPLVGNRASQQLYTLDGKNWVGTQSPVPSSALPPALLVAAQDGGAKQRFTYDGRPYLAVVANVSDATYAEVFSFGELDSSLKRALWLIFAIIILSSLLGGLLGLYFVNYLLKPMRELASSAHRLAAGELGARVHLTGDPDLDPIADTFNSVAEALESRLAREQRFSANVSHELRSPVTSVLGTAELLETRSGELPAREAGLVIVLAQQVRRLAQVLLDLLAISRINPEHPPQWESVNVKQLCIDCATYRGFDPALVNGDDTVIRTDARRVERVVGNLMENARTHGAGVVRVVILSEFEAVQVMVDDAGPGVPESLRDRVFEPFHRGEGPTARNGAGLGLAIAREQAMNIGGDIYITSSPEGGARFVAHFPTQEATS